MKQILIKIQSFLELGGERKDVVFLILSGISLLCSMFCGDIFPVDAAWIAVLLCGIPIILEAIVGLVTEFDIKADVLVSLALIASIFIGEIFAAGEIAFIMQLGSWLEEMTVARARAGIEKLVQLTPQTARVQTGSGEQIIAEKEGLQVLGWRKVPSRPEVLGHRAVECMPFIMQCFIKKPRGVKKGLDFDRKLYVARRIFEQ